MDAFSSIPEYQKAEFMRHLEDTTMKDSAMYVVLTT